MTFTFCANATSSAKPLGLVRRSHGCSWNHDETRSEFIEPVECCHLVRLGKSRVVEDAVAEELDGAVQCHHRLTDVNYFGRVFPDGMNAQHLERVGVKQNF